MHVSDNYKLKCPSCGGTDLKIGKIAPYRHLFIPQGRFMWRGYLSYSFACLDCGFLGHYLLKKDLDDMRRYDGKRKNTMP